MIREVGAVYTCTNIDVDSLIEPFKNEFLPCLWHG